MEDSIEISRITGLITAAMRLSTDPVSAASAELVAALNIEQVAQAIHLARCIAAFTTDDALATEMTEFVGESPKFLVSKVLAANYAPEKCTGEHAEFEKLVWKRLYAGRRERSRVKETLIRRGAL